MSFNQLNASNETTAAEAVREALKKIEHEHDLYENHEINRSNTSVLSSIEQMYSDMFSVDFSSASMVSFKIFTRTRNAFALFSEMMKYDLN